MPGETQGPAAEETTQTPQEEAGEEDQSEEETWEDKEGSKTMKMTFIGVYHDPASSIHL